MLVLAFALGLTPRDCMIDLQINAELKHIEAPAKMPLLWVLRDLPLAATRWTRRSPLNCAHSEASFVTGHILNVDGGHSVNRFCSRARRELRAFVIARVVCISRLPGVVQ